MASGRKGLRSLGWLAAVMLLCLPLALLRGLARSFMSGPPSWIELGAPYLFALILAWLAGLTAPARREQGWRWSWLTPAAAVLGVALLLAAPARESTTLSWLGLAALWFSLIHLGLSFVQVQQVRRTLAAGSFGLVVGLAGLAGFFPVAVLQWYERFSQEEAFAAAQAGVLAVMYLLLLLPAAWVARGRSFRFAGPGYLLRRRWCVLVLALLAAAVGLHTFQLYQASFFDPAPPAYAGISEESPFLCLPAAAARQVYDGKEVFARLVANVAANPAKRAPDYGMLALSTGALDWAQGFRAALLEEAAAGKFTGASNSVKYTQYEAALRAYYWPRVVVAFPALFSTAEEQRLREWFAAINRRALTVEWSDWVYAAALGDPPTGLYENQENGAGLVANLLAGNLADAGLAQADRDYLAANVRGWATRFRNSDDTVNYQAEWINNALFQSLAGQPVDEGRKSLAFEWLMLQALPSGRAPAYNFPNPLALAGVAYLGAVEQQAPAYIWLAGRALDYAEAAGRYVPAQPGLSAPVDLQGVAPAEGSCLIYGDSGLPNRGGPLAPDKIVLRSGWDPDDSYVLLNLRFSGWHRYKATNTIVLISLPGLAVNDQPGKTSFAWLPSGRSLLRDKRLGREDLSGLLVPVRGIASVTGSLSGIGAPWAQDPPWYAEVVRFGQEGSWEAATSRIRAWHGWEHTRSVYLLQGGDVVVVVDTAEGPPGEAPALAWQLDGAGWSTGSTGDAEQSGNGDLGQRIVLLAGPTLSPAAWQLFLEADGGASLRYASSTGGSLRAVTVFLANQAASAQVRLRTSAAENLLVIENGEKVETLSLVMPAG